MSKHPGLRMSVIGAFIFLISLALLAVMPYLVPSIVMVVGGLMVWGGLIWTLFGYYTPEGPAPPA